MGIVSLPASPALRGHLAMLLFSGLVANEIAPTALLFASAATFVLLQFATLRLPSAKVMAYTYLTPSWVILWEIALGHGAPRGLVLIGIIMTVVALVMLLRDDGHAVNQADSARPQGTARTHRD